ncbi:IS66 family transposase, partial [Acrocarpospora corrugata]|uniref:IS66 family transposase n=1 Tax=Acrocarpospora corrugata TaxID=35763 RepID=UPI0031CF8E64
MWDIAPITVEKAHWLLPALACGGCGTRTRAAAPFGQAGSVVYGPNVNAAAIILLALGNVPVERTAMLMEALLGTPVSPGFVAKAHHRFADKLACAGFDEAMKAALQGEDVLCAGETPVNVLRKNTDESGQPLPGQPHIVGVRTPDERLVWLKPIGARSKEAIKGPG